MTEREEKSVKRISSTLLSKVLKTVNQSESYLLARRYIAHLLREHHYKPYIKDLRYQARIALNQRKSREKYRA